MICGAECGSLSLRLDCYQSMLTRIWQQNHLQNVKNISAAENIVWSHRRPLSRGGSCWRRGRCGGTCSSDSDKYTLMGSWVCILHRITLIHDLYYWVVIFPIFSPAESTSYLWGSWFLAAIIAALSVRSSQWVKPWQWVYFCFFQQNIDPCAEETQLQLLPLETCWQKSKHFNSFRPYIT